ncbi:MAG: glutathione S-transferase family protein [Gaiellaceae bacterium]
MLTLYDAARCPFCARARIVLAEKSIEHETVVVDLDERPGWIVELNPPDGRVPVIEQPGKPLLPESRVIMRYLDECFPEPALMPDAPEERALVDVAFEQFERRMSNPYYRLKSGRAGAEELESSLDELDAELGQHDYLVGSSYSLADIAYLPWIIRAELLLNLPVRDYRNLAAWLERLETRPAVQAELAVVGALAV